MHVCVSVSVSLSLSVCVCVCVCVGFPTVSDRAATKGSKYFELAPQVFITKYLFSSRF